MEITSAGKLVYTHAVRLLDGFHHLDVEIGDFKGGNIGQVVAGGSIVPGTYWLPKLVSAYRKSHPKVHVKLQVLPAAELSQAVIEGRVDFGVTPVKYHDPFITADTLGTEEIVIVAAPDIAPQHLPGTLEELLQWDFVCAPHETLGRQYLDELLFDHGVSNRNVVMEIGHPEGVKRGVQAGLGLGIAHRWSVAEDLNRGTLQSVDVEGFPFSIPIYIVRRVDRYLSPVCQQFIATLFNEIQAEIRG
jgi:DNA-binding transcriptional LysR family regulator